MPSDKPSEFGERIAGQHYQPRPGSYAVILRDRNQIAVIRTPQGLFLPGGGAESGESPEETLRREVREECGRDVEIVRPLGFAIEYVFAESEGYFAKQCSFFQANLLPVQQNQTEIDHCLDWHAVPTAIERLTHRSHSWAVTHASKAGQEH